MKINLNIIKKFFTKPEDIENSSIKIEIISEEGSVQKTKQELFDAAVKQVTVDNLKHVIVKRLTEACYSQEELDDTHNWLQGERNGESKEELNKKYPKHVSYWRYNSYKVGINFDINRLSEKLAKDFIENGE